MGFEPTSSVAMAPWPGIEPGTFALTVRRSTAELPRNVHSDESDKDNFTIKTFGNHS